MKVCDSLEQRRSIKYFDPEHVMTAAEKEQLIRHVMYSPTAFNIQNWRFVMVEDKTIRQEIRKAAWDQPQVSEASLLIVLCFDKLAWARDPQRYWAHAPEDVATQFVSEIQDFYRDDEALQHDEGMRSCGIAAQSLMLLAKEMGYDSCAMDGFDFKRVGHLINLPGDHEICMLLTIGKRLRDPWPRGDLLPVEEVCFTDRFPD